MLGASTNESALYAATERRVGFLSGIGFGEVRESELEPVEVARLGQVVTQPWAEDSAGRLFIPWASGLCPATRLVDLALAVRIATSFMRKRAQSVWVIRESAAGLPKQLYAVSGETRRRAERTAERIWEFLSRPSSDASNKIGVL